MLPSTDEDTWFGAWRAMPDADRPVMRSYTVREQRRTPEGADEVDIDFVLHGDASPTSRWAWAAALLPDPGDRPGRRGEQVRTVPAAGRHRRAADVRGRDRAPRGRRHPGPARLRHPCAGLVRGPARGRPAHPAHPRRRGDHLDRPRGRSGPRGARPAGARRDARGRTAGRRGPVRLARGRGGHHPRGPPATSCRNVPSTGARCASPVTGGSARARRNSSPRRTAGKSASEDPASAL